MARKPARGGARKGTRRQPRPTTGGIPTVSGVATSRLGPLYLVRKAALNDPRLQERLQSAGSCQALAHAVNEYLKTHVKVTVSPEFERGAMRHTTESVFQNLFHVTEEDLKVYLEANTNPEGEFLLGQDELAMVAGSTRVVADTNTCSYGSGCGSCQCSSSLACVCK
jgi:hypothetical protein